MTPGPSLIIKFHQNIFTEDKKRDQMIDINNIISIFRISSSKRNDVPDKTCSFILVFNVSIIVSRKFPLIVTDLTFYPSGLFLGECQFLL